MKKLAASAATALIVLGLAACTAPAAQNDDAATDPTEGTSEMMGGDDAQPNPNLGTAEGQDLDEVDVKPTPDLPVSEDKMTGADAIEEPQADAE